MTGVSTRIAHAAYCLKILLKEWNRIDINFVLDTLIDDYKLVALLGEGWLRLTPEGQKMARWGMKNYQRKLSIKEQFKVAGKVIGAVSSVVGVISFLLGLLF